MEWKKKKKKTPLPTHPQPPGGPVRKYFWAHSILRINLASSPHPPYPQILARDGMLAHCASQARSRNQKETNMNEVKLRQCEDVIAMTCLEGSCDVSPRACGQTKVEEAITSLRHVRNGLQKGQYVSAKIAHDFPVEKLEFTKQGDDTIHCWRKV